MSQQPDFNPETLSGVTFFDVASNRNTLYIYPDAGHWTAGWLIVQNRSGAWMTLRKATDEDLAAINAAVVQSHHRRDGILLGGVSGGVVSDCHFRRVGYVCTDDTAATGTRED